MKPPEDAKSLQSILGLVNYLTRYSGHLATLLAPLRDLTKKDTAYSWGPEHDRALTEVNKEVLHYPHRSQAARDDLQEETKQLPCEITEVCTTSFVVRRYREVCKGSRRTHRRCPLQSITTASSTRTRIPTVRHPSYHKESLSITDALQQIRKRDSQRHNVKQTPRCDT